MSDLSDLRERVFARDGWRCVWPGCNRTSDLQLAHLTHRGMGGAPDRNTEANTVCACRFHHDILDGRTVQGRRFEVAELLRAYVTIRRRTPGGPQ